MKGLFFKLIFSFFLQLIFFIGFPSLAWKLGYQGSNWIRIWERVDDHKIFRDKSANKVVLLGDSDFGERYCDTKPETATDAVDDACSIRVLLDSEKKKYAHLKDLSFFDFSKSGTYPEAHLFFLLHLLDIKDGSLKYLVYSGPDRFTHILHERAYLILGELVADKIDALEPELQFPELKKISKLYRKKIDRFYYEEKFFRYRYFYRRMQAIFWSQRAYFSDLINSLKAFLVPNYEINIFNYYLARHRANYAKYDTDQFKGKLETISEEQKFKTEEDFEFLDLLKKITDAKKIKLIYFFSPNRDTCPNFHLEPCDSGIFQPVLKHFAKTNQRYIDLRHMDYFYPRDTIDLIHPTLSAKKVFAKELLDAMEKYETEDQK